MCVLGRGRELTRQAQVFLRLAKQSQPEASPRVLAVVRPAASTFTSHLTTSSVSPCAPTRPRTHARSPARSPATPAETYAPGQVSPRTMMTATVSKAISPTMRGSILTANPTATSACDFANPDIDAENVVPEVDFILPAPTLTPFLDLSLPLVPHFPAREPPLACMHARTHARTGSHIDGRCSTRRASAGCGFRQQALGGRPSPLLLRRRCSPVQCVRVLSWSLCMRAYLSIYLPIHTHTNTHIHIFSCMYYICLRHVWLQSPACMSECLRVMSYEHGSYLLATPPPKRPAGALAQSILSFPLTRGRARRCLCVWRGVCVC